MTRALVADVAAESKEKLPLFHGNGKDEIRARDLVRRIDAQHTLRGGAVNSQCQMLYYCLRGAAAVWYENVEMQDCYDAVGISKDWQLMKKAFLSRYDRARTDLNSVTCGHPKQKKGETASDFLD